MLIRSRIRGSSQAASRSVTRLTSTTMVANNSVTRLHDREVAVA